MSFVYVDEIIDKLTASPIRDDADIMRRVAFHARSYPTNVIVDEKGRLMFLRKTAYESMLHILPGVLKDFIRSECKLHDIPLPKIVEGALSVALYHYSVPSVSIENLHSANVWFLRANTDENRGVCAAGIILTSFDEEGQLYPWCNEVPTELSSMCLTALKFYDTTIDICKGGASMFLLQNWAWKTCNPCLLRICALFRRELVTLYGARYVLSDLTRSSVSVCAPYLMPMLYALARIEHPIHFDVHSLTDIKVASDFYARPDWLENATAKCETHKRERTISFEKQLEREKKIETGEYETDYDVE